MNAEESKSKAGPPYMSWATLENLIERMDKDGVPGRIDRSVLGGSEGYKTQVLAGLRWLELIDQEGSVTATFERMVSDSGNRQELVGKLFREKFPKQIELGEKNASPRELEESFAPYSGDTARKAVSFYLKGAQFAGLPLSTYFKMPRNRRPSTSKSRSTRKTPKNGGSGATPTSGLNSEGLHPALAGLLNDIPRGGKGWTEEEREEFMGAFQVMVRYAIPVAGSAEGQIEAEDEDEVEEES